MALDKAAAQTENNNGGKDEVVTELISFFTDKFVNTKVRGNLPLSLKLDNLEKHAESQGLTAESINDVIGVVLQNKFAATVNKRLVRLLLPSHSVCVETVTKTLSWMCTGVDNFPLMVLLMRWIVLIQPYVDNKEGLHSLYDVIFHFTQSDRMCPHACELLYHLTRKEDVRLYRVQELLQLQRKRGPEPYLLGLLMVYKLYCPHLVSISIPASRKNFFRATDRLWAEKIRALQRKRVDFEDDNGSTYKPPPSKKAKRSLPAVCPAVLSARSCLRANQQPRDGHTQTRTLVPFAQIKSFKQLLQNLDRLELPGQLSAALKDRNLQHVLVCYPDAAIPLRITYWLDYSLNEEFFVNGAKDKEYCRELLDTLVVFTGFLQESIPVCQQFLSIYLQTWSGVQFRSQLLNLVTHSRLHSFSDLCDLLLEPLRKLFFCSDVHFKCEILETFTSLLRNLVQVELPRYRQMREREHIALSNQNEQNKFSVFNDVVEADFSALDTMQDLIRLTNSMCSVGLEIEENHPLLCHAVFNFFEFAASLYACEGVPVVEVCSEAIAYKQLFTNNPVSLAMLLGLVNRYRDSCVALQTCGSGHLSDEARLYRATSLDINSYIVNICDTLHRDRAFISTDERSIFGILDESVEGLDKVKCAKSLSLYRHPALLCYSHKFLKKTQREGTFIHPDQIQPHRDVYLKFLNQHGLQEISSFLRTFIRPRQSSRKSMPQNVDSNPQNIDSDLQTAE